MTTSKYKNGKSQLDFATTKNESSEGLQIATLRNLVFQ